MNISVCMATYNGEKYVVEQMRSILKQLKHNDEVIVVDDFSSDNTLNLLRGLNDSRIRIYLNKRNMKHVFSFNRAISLAKKDVIFLADQDDVWIKDRVASMANKLIDSGAMLLSSNHDRIGNTIYLPLYELLSSESSKHFKNIFNIYMGKANYFGCCMAFRRDFVKLILPIPSFVKSHDLWISIASNLIGSNVHMDEYTLRRRLHNENVSSTNRCIFMKIWARLIFTLSIIVLLPRVGSWFKNLNDG